MAEILTTSFKTDTTRLFLNDALTNDYYLFSSSIDATVSANSLRSKNSFLEKTLFGKKVLNQDIFYMIKYYPWQANQVFTQYDDIADLEGTNFYAVVGPNNNDTGDYRVYKCLNNNFGSPVTSPPNFDPTTIDQVYRTPDGYVWKYMYVLTELQFDAYNAVGYIPITGTFDANPAQVDGSSLSDISLNNADINFGYTKEEGYVQLEPDSTSIRVVPTTGWNPTSQYYTGQTIYITNTISGTTFLYEILSYEFNTPFGVPEIIVKDNDGATPATDGVERNATFTILPRIEILGDGTGASAVPIINNNSIDSIVILNSGSGYSDLRVSVIDPLFNFEPDNPASADVRAEVRGIIGPKGGHGYDLLDEFKCKHILLYAYITEDNNNNIGATNTYGTMGFVKNPTFKNTAPDVFDNRLAITTADINAAVVNTTITQVNADNEIVFSGTIHEVDVATNTIYIAEYCGPYQDTPGSDISFDPALPFTSQTGQAIRINTPVETNIVTSEYTQRTGEVYFMEDFFPLARTQLSREEFKLVLEF